MIECVYLSSNLSVHNTFVSLITMRLLRSNTYPVDKTLEEPFSAVNTAGHLLLILIFFKEGMRRELSIRETDTCEVNIYIYPNS